MNSCFVSPCNWAFLESLAEPVERQMDWKQARRVSDRLGPGYRLYLAQAWDEVFILYVGGTKKRQQRQLVAPRGLRQNELRIGKEKDAGGQG